MEIFRDIRPLQAFLAAKRSSSSVGLVPTMGALHVGHTSLIRTSRANNDLTVCSLFVNPTQFSNRADLEKYPRTPNEDLALLEREGCDVLFMPDTGSMYEQPGVLKLDFGELDKILEGKFRPGHFSGVGLVVSKLFNIIQPQQAYFGQKDFQQYGIISVLVEELKFNIKLHCLPTVRAPDGLAMSSRNQRLTQVERKSATVLYESLLLAQKNLRSHKPWAAVKEEVNRKIENLPIIKLEYFELAHRENLLIWENVSNRNAILLIAGFVGEVRLIDNLFVED